MKLILLIAFIVAAILIFYDGGENNQFASR